MILSFLIYSITTFVQLMFCVFFFDHVCKKKHVFILTLVCYYIPFECIHLLSLIVPKSIPISIFTAAKMLLSFLIVLIFYDVSFFRALRVNIEFTLLQMMVELPAVAIIRLVLHYDIVSEYSANSGSVYVSVGRIFPINLFLLVILAAVILHNRKLLRSRRDLMDYLLLAAFDLLHFVFMLIFYSVNLEGLTEMDNLIQIIMQTLLFSLLIIQYYNIRRTRALMENEQELDLLKAEIDNNYRYYLLADSRFDEVAQIRRDLKDQLSSFRQLLNDKERHTEAESIMDSISRRLSSIKAVNYCGNKTINAVLTLKLNDERLKDISTQILLEDCDGLTVSDYDLCSLVSNLFDNAAESCLRADGGEVPFIEMRSGRRNDFFVIRVTNTCCDETVGTSFKGVGHGYGLKIIEDICRRHGGEFIFKREDSTATSIAYLKDTEK